MNSQALIAMSLKRSIEFDESGFYVFDLPGDGEWEVSIDFFYRPIDFRFPELLITAKWPGGPALGLPDVRTAADLRERLVSLRDGASREVITIPELPSIFAGNLLDDLIAVQLAKWQEAESVRISLCA
ncbi:hypothetical protein ASC97_07535 [Rhizobium sp. Root1203]|nr:hypothetical protein ASC97_07535 [Rhizobium sp. Root1203]